MEKCHETSLGHNYKDEDEDKTEKTDKDKGNVIGFCLIQGDSISNFKTDSGLYFIEFKGFGDGEGNKRGKQEKKGKFGENITFGRTKS